MTIRNAAAYFHGTEQGAKMTDPTSQADHIISKWPGADHVEQRRAMSKSLGHKDEEKVRYWQKRGEIPQGEWQSILDAAHRERVKLRKSDFVQHLKEPAKTAVATATA